jgi:hypothetical protein
VFSGIRFLAYDLKKLQFYVELGHNDLCSRLHRVMQPAALGDKDCCAFT